jgi:uncharacterized protein YceH (UPF0502 family)
MPLPGEHELEEKNDENARLEKRVAELEKRVAELEQRLGLAKGAYGGPPAA